MQIIKENSIEIALLTDETSVLYGEQSTLNLIGELCFNREIAHVVVPAEALSDNFFNLRTRLAGNILQKFINYGVRLAIVGDFSTYRSKNLHQFIFESNKSKDVIFAASIDEAIKKFSL